MEDPWWRKFFAHLIGGFLAIGGAIVGVYLGIALVDTIATGQNAFWPIDLGRKHGTDFVHGAGVILGLSIGGVLGGYIAFPFLMRVTGLVSEHTVEKMFERPRQKRRRPKRFD